MQSPKSTLKTLLPRPRLFIESALLADTAIIIMNYLLWKHTADRMKYPTVHIIRCKIKAWTLSTSSWQTAAEVSALKNRLEKFFADEISPSVADLAEVAHAFILHCL